MVGLNDPEALRRFAADVAAMRDRMVKISEPGEHMVPLLRSGGALGVPALIQPGLDEFELFTGNLARATMRFIGDGIGGTSGLAYRAAWIATNFPAVDLEERRRLADVAARAEAAVPAPPEIPR